LKHTKFIITYDPDAGTYVPDSRALWLVEAIKKVSNLRIRGEESISYYCGNMLAIFHVRSAIARKEIDPDTIVFRFPGMEPQKADEDGKVKNWDKHPWDIESSLEDL